MINKQQKILNSAIKLFIQYGMRKTTMDDIAQRANVSKVTIYKYFGDKESLYLEVGKSIFEKYMSILHRQVNTDESIDNKLHNVINTLTDFVVKNHLTLCKDLSRLNDSLEEEYAYFNAEYKLLITQLIDEGKNIGRIKNNINSNIAFYYVDMGISYFQNNIDYRERMLNDTAFQNEFMTFILSNIFIKDGEYN